ncbi:hypothetical protein AB0L74_28040 [Streptomyces sp. NPDC052020]|uniref:hypothetical protein n=1 Tax=Streptomyces sp. NPDC052020 TaxID=3155677 RepID=UPI00342AC174
MTPDSGHRAEPKPAVRRDARGRGRGRTLPTSAERAAGASGIALPRLDTESGSPAERLYRCAGRTRAGAIPEYAADPHGVLQPTAPHHERIGAARAAG